MRRRGRRIADSSYPGPTKRAGASYLVNRLEASGDLGMGAVAVASLGVVASLKGELSTLLVLVAGFGVLLAALYYGFGRRALVPALMAIEAVFGAVAIAVYTTF